MKVDIEINCKTTSNLVFHLLEIIKDIKDRSGGDQNYDFVGTHFYKKVSGKGDHEVKITGRINPLLNL